MYEFWYDYVKPINGLKEKLYYKDTIFYSLHTKKEDIYSDNAKEN